MAIPFGPFATVDTYSAAATFDRFMASRRLTFDVESNPVYMQLQLGLAGSWSGEIKVRPGTFGRTFPTPFTGVRFRSATPGLPGTVEGTVLYE